MWNPLRSRREKREAHLLEREAFRSAKRLAREDVLVLGEDVAALALPHDASYEVREHHRFALEGYDRARGLLDAADGAGDIDRLDEVLQLARWELAAVRALEAGEPLPPRRGPCFFNPQHGPAVVRLAWAPPQGTERQVEACRACELRLETGADPKHREVRVGDRFVPWWQASSVATFSSMPTAQALEGTHGPLVAAAMTEAQLRASMSMATAMTRGM